MFGIYFFLYKFGCVLNFYQQTFSDACATLVLAVSFKPTGSSGLQG